MKNTEKKKSMTHSEALQDPSLSVFHEAIRSVQNKSNKDIAPKKYQAAMLDLASEKTFELYEQNTYMPLKTAIISVFQSFKSDLSADLILKMTKQIIEEWENLHATIHQESPIAIAA